MKNDFVFSLDEEGTLPEVELWETLMKLPILNAVKVLNSGQGEGQFSHNGQEWGFYYNSRGPELIAHDPTISKSAAEEFVARVRAELRITLMNSKSPVAGDVRRE